MATVGNSRQASMIPGLTRLWRSCRQIQGPISPGRPSLRVQHFRSSILTPSPDSLRPHRAASPLSNCVRVDAQRSVFLPRQGCRQGKPASPRCHQRGGAEVPLPRRGGGGIPGAQTGKLSPVRLSHHIRQLRHRDTAHPRQKGKRLSAHKRTAVGEWSDTEKSGNSAAFLQT